MQPQQTLLDKAGNQNPNRSGRTFLDIEQIGEMDVGHVGRFVQEVGETREKPASAATKCGDSSELNSFSC